MPEAIATTKRKFYKALDALTTSASTSKTAQPPECPLSSAAAFDEARERAAKRVRLRASAANPAELTNAASVARLPPPPPQPPAPRSSKQLPPFSPWSQQTFLARLETFSNVSKWHPKPDAISEVAWAKRGWVCVDVNTVACSSGCGKRVVVSVERQVKNLVADQEAADEEDYDEGESAIDAEAVENALVERYQHLTIEGHSETCLWRKAGCKDDIYRLALVRPAVWQPELQQRVQSVLHIRKSVVAIEISIPSPANAQPSETRKLIDELPSHVLSPIDAQPAEQERAFYIAMHGWRGVTEAGTDLLKCDACFQRIGLWMYQPSYRSKHLSEEDGDESSQATVDLLEMHRYYCPWRNAESQKATESLHGLNASQILARVVASCVRDHRRRTRDDRSYLDEEPENAAPEPNDEPATVLSREEVVRQDKDRESRLRKLKNLFSVKRRTSPLTSRERQ